MAKKQSTNVNGDQKPRKLWCSVFFGHRKCFIGVLTRRRGDTM